MLLDADNGVVQTEKHIKDWQARRVLLAAQLDQMLLAKPAAGTDEHRLRLLQDQLRRKSMHL